MRTQSNHHFTTSTTDRGTESLQRIVELILNTTPTTDRQCSHVLGVEPDSGLDTKHSSCVLGPNGFKGMRGVSDDGYGVEPPTAHKTSSRRIVTHTQTPEHV